MLLEPTDVAGWTAALDTMTDQPRDPARIAAGLERARAFTWEACAASAVRAMLVSMRAA
jgi:hypothetical protein